MLQWLYTYVTKVCSKCFICFFRCILQVCLTGCCICFTHMLQVFYLDVAYVCNESVLSRCYVCLQWFSNVFRCFCKCFRRMLQVFHLSSFCMLQLLHMDVSKVDRLLHIRCAWEAIGDAGPLLGHSLASPTHWGTCSLAR